ncbi:MAG: hypothetical protein M0R74_03310 [Dehalococcoidia bacterium]|nr:hypothetical protein [Dehalococcoidia bacterium]
MRQLITNDVFKMSRIFKKLGIKIDELLKEEPDEKAGTNDDNSDEKFGLRLIQVLVENAYLAQAEINDFIGDLFGMTGEEFGKLPLTESIEKIKELKKLDGIGDFFKQVGQLTKQA